MQQLKTKIDSRITYNFFRSKAHEILDNEDMQPYLIQLQQSLCAALNKTLAYLEKWFDFSVEGTASVMNHLPLNKELEFQFLKTVCSVIGIMQEIDLDVLYDEFCAAKQTLTKLVATSTACACNKWQEFFKRARDSMVFPTNMFIVASTAVSLPGSNAFPRIFFDEY
jgi:hypothetical protein